MGDICDAYELQCKALNEKNIVLEKTLKRIKLLVRTDQFDVLKELCNGINI
jgi:hypothetical protein